MPLLLPPLTAATSHLPVPCSCHRCPHIGPLCPPITKTSYAPSPLPCARIAPMQPPCMHGPPPPPPPHPAPHPKTCDLAQLALAVAPVPAAQSCTSTAPHKHCPGGAMYLHACVSTCMRPLQAHAGGGVPRWEPLRDTLTHACRPAGGRAGHAACSGTRSASTMHQACDTCKVR